MAPISAADYCVRMGDEIKTGAFWRDVISELLSTFLFVFGVLVLRQDWYGADMLPRTLQIAIGTAFLWTALGYGLGDFGGAHMNNAITFACMIRAEVSFLKALFYWLMQAGGAIAAAFVVFLVTPIAKLSKLGAESPINDDVVWWQAVVIEAFATAILCFAYLACYSVERKGYVILSSLPVGLSSGLGVFISMASTGAVMNSMLYLGPAVVNTVFGLPAEWGVYWIYWAGPMGGGLLAAIIYWIFDRVDAVENSPSPYYMQSGTWSYNNDPPRRPQVMPNTQNIRTRLDSKEILNRPSTDGGDIYKVNGMSVSDNGHVSAYSRGRIGED